MVSLEIIAMVILAGLSFKFDNKINNLHSVFTVMIYLKIVSILHTHSVMESLFSSF